jgi:CheY-like chemotaxis protein
MSELEPDDRDSTQRILVAGRHLLTLINELIDIGRIESGEMKLSVEPVSVHGLTEEVAALMEPLAAARAITIEREGESKDLTVYADHQRLRQVLVNLASNAVKYNHHGGMIRIGYRRGDRDDVAIWVTDTGPGLTEEEIERVFVPFERLAAEQHGIEGTGIGLPLALALTRAMRGTLEVTSNPGYGSTFTVRLAEAETVADLPLVVAPVTPAKPRVPDGSLVVLSIEDNAANTEILNRVFRGWPGTVLHSAISAQAGLDLASQYRPDLILLDLHLPDLPGEEVYTRLRAEPATANVPVVVLSADATPGTIRRLLARGVLAYLTKPLDLAELQTVLARAGASANARPDQGSEPIS